MALIMGFSFVEAFVLPHLYPAVPGFAHAWMGMFNGPAGRFDLGALPTVWTLTGFIYILGGLLFGIATFRAGVLPRWAGAAGPRHRAGPGGRPAAERLTAEDRHAGRDSARLARLCPVVRAATATPLTERPRQLEWKAPKMTSGMTQATPSRTAEIEAGQVLHAPTTAEQRTARIMGAWFLGTILFSVPAFWFYDPLLNHAGYVLGGGHDTRVGVGAVLEILLAISGIATAVVIFPIARRVNESVALGYVACRTVESILILIGVLSLLSVVALRQDLSTAGVQGPAQLPLVDVARSLLAVHDQTALLGPQFCAGLGNGILLGYLMWRSRLLPRPMVMVGLIGGPLAVLAGVGVVVGAWDISDGLPVALTAPEALWELSLSVWLLTKGFRPSPVLTGRPAK